MKKYGWLVAGVLGCLVIAAVGYFWATGLMDSVFNYRSQLKDIPPAPGAALGEPLTRRVVIVLIDALRVDTASDETVMPYLNQLRNQAASAIVHSQPPSYSEPGYSTILTGAWPEINDGPAVNLDYEDIPTFTQDDIFSAAHRAGLRTAISGYYWFEKLVPQQAVDAGFYTPGEDAAADQDVMNAAMTMLAGDNQLVLIHLDQVDYAGHHEGGPRDPRWDAAAARCDEYLQQIVSMMDLEQDTLIVLSDHGQIDRGGHGGPELITLREPFVMAGVAVLPGTYPDIQQVDVAPTVAALLGTNLPASTEGQVRSEMLTLSPEHEAEIQAVDATQKKTLYQAYVTAIGSQPTQQPDPSDPLSYVTAMIAARDKRLSAERVWRSLVALILAILPAYILATRVGKRALWWGIGALVYALAFNFRYAILDGRTYSLSSVDSQTWIITYTATTAFIALVVGWLVAMFTLRAFRLDPGNAARSSLGFVFTTIYLLALPILVSFALNGALVTWTMPEFYSSYIALQSLIQWIIVAAAGLALTGIAAGIGKLASRRS